MEVLGIENLTPPGSESSLAVSPIDVTALDLTVVVGEGQVLGAVAVEVPNGRVLCRDMLGTELRRWGWKPVTLPQ